MYVFCICYVNTKKEMPIYKQIITKKYRVTVKERKQYDYVNSEI